MAGSVKNRRKLRSKPTTDEWRYYQQKFLESLPQAQIHEITRIQNKWIWHQYLFEKRRLQDKNKGVVNEMELFHGCRERG